MKKLKTDIRYIILNELNQMGHSTEDIPINNFLATIKTFIGTEDIGTIKRAIQELIKEEYVAESPNHIGKVEAINSSGPHDTAKNPKRFIEAIGDAPKINDIYLFITLKGKKFLIEWAKLESDASNSKFLKQTRIVTLVLALGGFGLGIFNLKSCNNGYKSEISKEEEIVKIDSTKYRQNNISEDPYRFKNYINETKIGTTITELTKDSAVYETTYLGMINVGNEHLHVLSQFYVVQAAITRHGHSRILFLYNDGKLKKEYILDMPEELPTSIKNNRLKLRDKLFDPFKDELPEIICIPNGGCY